MRTESSQCGIDRVRSVGGGDDDHVTALLHTVHQSEQLRHDAPLDLAVRLKRNRTVHSTSTRLLAYLLSIFNRHFTSEFVCSILF